MAINVQHTIHIFFRRPSFYQLHILTFHGRIKYMLIHCTPPLPPITWYYHHISVLICLSRNISVLGSLCCTKSSQSIKRMIDKLSKCLYQSRLQLTDAGVCKLTYHCPLRYMVLAGIHNLTDKSIFAIANSCPNLEEIYLNGCAQITRQAIAYLMVRVVLKSNIL